MYSSRAPGLAIVPPAAAGPDNRARTMNDLLTWSVHAWQLRAVTSMSGGRHAHTLDHWCRTPLRPQRRSQRVVPPSRAEHPRPRSAEVCCSQLYHRLPMLLSSPLANRRQHEPSGSSLGRPSTHCAGGACGSVLGCLRSGVCTSGRRSCTWSTAELLRRHRHRACVAHPLSPGQSDHCLLKHSVA